MSFYEAFSFYIDLILFLLGLVSVVLVPIIIAAGYFLYKVTKKKWILVPSIIITLFLACNFYYVLPGYLYVYVAGGNLAEKRGILDFAYKISSRESHKADIIGWNAFIAKMNLDNGAYSSEKEIPKLLDDIFYYGNKSCTQRTSFGCVALYETYMALGKYEEAIYVYGHSPLLSRGAGEVYVTMYMLNKDYEGAMNALQYIKKQSAAKRYKAEIYRRSGKPLEALKILNELIKDGDKNCHTFAYRAYVYNDLGKINLSKADWKSAAKLCGMYERYENYNDFLELSKPEHWYDEKKKMYADLLKEAD